MTLRGQGIDSRAPQAGHAMAVLLVGLAVMGILMSVAMPVWRKAVQREKEEELVFRGQQYARAVGLFQRKYAGAFPVSVDMLVEQRFLRRKYVDPMTRDGEFQILYQLQAAATPGQGSAGASRTFGGATSPLTTAAAPRPVPGQASAFGQGTAGPRGGIIGVASKSTEQSIRLYNGRSRYSEWQFVYTAVSNRVGVPGAPPGASPGLPGGIGGRQFTPGGSGDFGRPIGRPGGSGTAFPPTQSNRPPRPQD